MNEDAEWSDWDLQFFKDFPRFRPDDDESTFMDAVNDWISDNLAILKKGDRT